MTKEYNRGIEAAANMIDVARKLNNNPDSAAYRSLTHAHVMVLGMMVDVPSPVEFKKEPTDNELYAIDNVALTRTIANRSIFRAGVAYGRSMRAQVATKPAKKQSSKYQPLIIACAPDFVPREATPREELEYYLSKNLQVKLNRGKYTLETTVTLLGERVVK